MVDTSTPTHSIRACLWCCLTIQVDFNTYLTYEGPTHPCAKCIKEIEENKVLLRKYLGITVQQIQGY